MNDPARPTGDDDLQAYIDERLPAVRRREIDSYLAGHPEEARRVAAYRAQREALREALRPKAQEPIPSRLRVAHVVADRRRRLLGRLAVAAAAIALMAAGALGGWYAHGVASPRGNATEVASEAFAAYRTFVVEVVHPVEVGAGQEVHLVQWLSKRLGRKIAAPDLTGEGYKLMGGRLLPAGSDVAAQFMYEDAKGLRLTLYVRAGESGETAFRFASQGDVSAFYWIDHRFGYVVTAKAGREQLLGVARKVYDQIAGPA